MTRHLSRPHRLALLAAGALLGGFAAAPAHAATATTVPPPAPAPAPAPTPVSHNPIGGLTGTTATPTGLTPTGLTLTGWAVDPDTPTANATVFALVDGVTRATQTTSLPNAAITTAYHAGPTPGFVLTVPVPAGKHTVCFAVRNSGPGTSVVGRCLATPLGRKAGAKEIAAHSPTGVLSRVSATATSVQASGFVTDQDFRSKHQTVVLYVDGRSAATVSTTRTLAGAPAGSGANASFLASAPVAVGTHQACVWAVNVGWGRNTFLGCQAVDTRAGLPLAVGSPPATVLPKVLAEAMKHIGQRYVWGAIGPKTFDCSGLMMFSYRKNGFVTPRIAADQARAARLIPASHAQPGDLVFYHDSEGDVYHVGMYVSPGLTVAAIDEAEGVDYQRIWDPTTASYGSFTHL